MCDLHQQLTGPDGSPDMECYVPGKWYLGTHGEGLPLTLQAWNTSRISYRLSDTRTCTYAMLVQTHARTQDIHTVKLFKAKKIVHDEYITERQNALLTFYWHNFISSTCKCSEDDFSSQTRYLAQQVSGDSQCVLSNTVYDKI